jgi:hypothetical protein
MSNDEIEKKILIRFFLKKKQPKSNWATLQNLKPDLWDRDYFIEDKHKKIMMQDF